MSIILPLSWEVWIGSFVVLIICTTFIAVYAKTWHDNEVTAGQGILFVLGGFLDESQEKVFHLR